ncbi:hypothetical protein CV014_23055 [Nostoc sp. CMAA1605]|nr:hypothetical protein [Nostoc sp. CMAA1605]
MLTGKSDTNLENDSGKWIEHSTIQNPKSKIQNGMRWGVTRNRAKILSLRVPLSNPSVIEEQVAN